MKDIPSLGNAANEADCADWSDCTGVRRVSGPGTQAAEAAADKVPMFRDREGKWVVLALTGALDATRQAELGELCRRLLAQRDDEITFDLHDVSVLDSAAIGALTPLFRRAARQGKRVRLVGLRRQPLAVVTRLSLHRIVAIEP